MRPDFVAIDVETANSDCASICQIGMAAFQDGKLVREWKSYVNPEADFDPMNISIHGINEATVRGAPTFAAIVERLHEELDGTIAVHHTPFDRVSIVGASGRYQVRPPGCKWLDSARVARRTWPEVRRSGYGLGALAESIGLTYEAHDALEDAKAAGAVFLEAVRASGASVEEWLARAYAPLDPSRRKGGAQEGNPDGPLWGDVLVFTGALTIPRADAAEMAAKLGCEVKGTVTKNTTILVVGDQDLDRTNFNEKSSKHRRAEQLAAAGQPIRFLSESQFSRLLDILEDGKVTPAERREAKRVVASATPGQSPQGLGIARQRPKREREPEPRRSSRDMSVTFSVDLSALMPKPREFLCVQYLRDANAPSPDAVPRVLETFGTLLEQDLGSNVARLEALGDTPQIGAVLEVIQEQVLGCGSVAKVVVEFSKRTPMADSQRARLHSGIGQIVRMKLESARGFLANIVGSVTGDDRVLATAMLESVTTSLAAL